jgi:hypothetical protein
MYQQLWGHKVEEKLHLGVREQKRLNTTAVDDQKKHFEALSSWDIQFLPQRKHNVSLFQKSIG